MRKLLTFIFGLIAFACAMAGIFLPMQEGIHALLTSTLGSTTTVISESSTSGWAYIFGQVANSETGAKAVSQNMIMFITFVLMCIGTTLAFVGCLFTKKNVGKVIFALAFAATLEAGIFYLDAAHLMGLENASSTTLGVVNNLTYTLGNGFLYAGILGLVSSISSLLATFFAGKNA
jgi:hypothetical protein